MTILLIALGGAVGSVFRYLLVDVVQKATHASFPVGTLTVNVAGSILVGVLMGWAMNSPVSPYFRPALIVGFCGGFTTFSAFSIETVGLLVGGEYVKGLAYVLASVLLCLGGAAAGFLTWSRSR